ncbi:MAG TPA: M14 family zinc carboxypeptidase, partial [Ignavibacteriaceae bacterium]|nr:M14 family zinc carboxypeptidase [Ignavibacteriaceae bacterium]
MDFIQQLFHIYDNYKEPMLTNRRYSHSDLMLVLKKFDDSNVIKKNLLGTSVEYRQIFLYKIGSGKKKVLLWSQMHGDESTATSAFVDLFNFFEYSSNELFVKEKILQELTLYFIPMLNPDGAEKFIRFNAQGIDINRDAKSLQSPEAKILLKAVEDIKPDFAFNMHDQDYRWSVGGNDKVVALSFLAPAFDDAKTVDPTREKAINLLSGIIKLLSDYTESRITRYSDDYEPRSFGDTIAGRGISTILVEAGRWQNDLEKSYLRKLNFLVLLFAMSRIAENFIENDSRKYFETPYNGKFLFDLILRRVKLKINSTESIVDIAINREFHFDDNDRSS